MSSQIAWEWSDFHGPAIQAKVRAALGVALNVAGEHVLGVSNQQVPHEDGDLERSGTVTSGDKEVAVSYDTPYAVIQHEDLSLRHDNGRNAKYLENACKSEAKVVGRLIQTHLKRTIGD